MSSEEHLSLFTPEREHSYLCHISINMAMPMEVVKSESPLVLIEPELTISDVVTDSC